MDIAEFNFLRGSNVALVGGADTYDESQLDGYDYVVRINNHWLRRRGRIDVLYHTRSLVNRIIDELPTTLRLVICVTSDPYNTHPRSRLESWCDKHQIPMLMHWRTPCDVPNIYSIEEPPFYRVVMPLYRNDLKELYGNYNPFAGTMAYYILKTCSNAKTLHCYGFDFYENHPSWPKVGGHNAEIDKILMADAEFL